MPRQPAWKTRIPEILQALTAERELLDRRDIERLFDLSRSQAGGLMTLVGTTQSFGTASAVQRSALETYLRHCKEGVKALATSQTEMDRRRKLAAKLNAAAADLQLREIPIEAAKPADEWARFKDLPNVSLEPGRLTITFVSEQDLYHQLWLLSRALLNEPVAVGD